MALKAILTAEEHGKLSDALKGEYKETSAGSGKYAIQIVETDGNPLDNIDRIKTTLSKERTRAEDLAKKLEVFGDIKPEEAKAAMAKVAEMANWKPDEKVRETIEAQAKVLNEKWGKDVAAKDTEISSMRAQLEAQLITAAATKAIADKKGRVLPLLPHVRAQIRMDKDSSGRYVARVVDETGNPRITQKPGSTDPMSIEELVDTLKASNDFKVLFDGTGASGTGASAAGGGGSAQGGSVSMRDMNALGANLEAIATGKVTVTE